MGDASPEASGELELPEYADDVLAQEFVLRHSYSARYVDNEKSWYHHLGTHWERDGVLLIFRQARHVCWNAAKNVQQNDELYGQYTQKQRAAMSAELLSSKKIYAVEKLARSCDGLAVSPDIWDRDLYAFNTPAGTIDLRSGEIREHARADYITKIAAVSAGGKCPQFLKFLLRVCGDDPEIVGFLQRFFGSCLTGDVRDHVVLFFYGTGANGKSTLLRILQLIMGGYAMSVPPETFQEQHGERHPADMAMLRAARLAVAQEADEGRRWNAPRLKAGSGGDPIVARFMRGNFFSYTPQFKLVFAGNHKPRLRNVDEAIRRRLHLIPFTQTIPPAERDLALAERLVSEEGPGILAWLVRGCLNWQREGLNVPPAIRAATDAYLSDEDIISQWIGDACERREGEFTAIAELHASYKTWAERGGERFLGTKSFSQGLEDRGFQRWQQRELPRARGFLGLKLKPVENGKLL